MSPLDDGSSDGLGTARFGVVTACELGLSRGAGVARRGMMLRVDAFALAFSIGFDGALPGWSRSVG